MSLDTDTGLLSPDSTYLDKYLQVPAALLQPDRDDIVSRSMHIAALSEFKDSALDHQHVTRHAYKPKCAF